MNLYWEFSVLTSANTYIYFRNWIFISFFPRSLCFSPMCFPKFWLSTTVTTQEWMLKVTALLLPVLTLCSISKSNYVFVEKSHSCRGLRCNQIPPLYRTWMCPCNVINSFSWSKGSELYHFIFTMVFIFQTEILLKM